MSIICIKCGTSKDDIDANGDNSCDHIWKRQATKIDDLNNIIFVENRTTEHIILNIKWNESASDTMSNFAIPNHVYERVAHYPYVHICSNEVVVYPKNACYTNGYVVALYKKQRSREILSEKPISDIPLGEIYVLSYLRNHKVDLKSGECIVISNGSPQIVNQEAAGSALKN